MSGILIKIKDGHQMDGEGESLGKDNAGQNYTFWKSSGHMEIPVELAVRLQLERPQRFEIVDKKLVKQLNLQSEDTIVEEKPEIIVESETIEDKIDLVEPEVIEIKTVEEVMSDGNVPEEGYSEDEEPKEINEDTITTDQSELITLKEIKSMTKDRMNDWAAINGYELKSNCLKLVMRNKLIKQIQKRIGHKIKKE